MLCAVRLGSCAGNMERCSGTNLSLPLPLLALKCNMPPSPSHCAALPHAAQVLVLRLQTSGTVEERIVQVASDKRSMADRSITGGCMHRGHRACGIWGDMGVGCSHEGLVGRAKEDSG